MKVGTTISAVAHTVILTWGLFALPDADPFDTAPVEALPVEFVTLDEFTELEKGVDTAKEVTPSEATVDAKPVEVETPTETAGPSEQTPEEVDNVAVDNSAEQVVQEQAATTTQQQPDVTPQPEKPTPPAPQPRPVQKAEVEPEKPVEKEPEPKPDEISDLIKEQPKEEPKEQPSEEPQEKPEEAEKTERPTPPVPKVNPRKKQVAEKEVESKTDELADLISKEKAATKNAGQTKEKASVGTKTGTKNAKMTQNELDGLTRAISKCWTVPPAVALQRDFSVQITMNLNKDGSVSGRPKIGQIKGVEDSARRVIELNARRAVTQCGPYSLPADKYETWKVVNVIFSP